MAARTRELPGLSAAQLERLALLAEECAEVVMAVTKIQRHGFSSYNPLVPGSLTNREALEKEVGHVLCAIQILLDAEDVQGGRIDGWRGRKQAEIHRWLHHQSKPGPVPAPTPARGRQGRTTRRRQ